MNAGLLDAYGDEFYQKFVEARRKNRFEKLKINDEIKNQIIHESKTKLSPDNPSFNFMHNDVLYHVLLVEAPTNMNVRELRFGKSLGFRWKGSWVSVILSDEDLDKIEPDQAYLLVGYLKEREGKTGRKFLNFTCHGVITMDEVIKHNREVITDEEATENALKEGSQESQ